MIVALLTEEQRNNIRGQKYQPDVYFNVLRDAGGNPVITREQCDNCKNEYFSWVKDLPLIEYEPRPVTPTEV